MTLHERKREEEEGGVEKGKQEEKEREEEGLGLGRIGGRGKMLRHLLADRTWNLFLLQGALNYPLGTAAEEQKCHTDVCFSNIVFGGVALDFPQVPLHPVQVGCFSGRLWWEWFARSLQSHQAIYFPRQSSCRGLGRTLMQVAERIITQCGSAKGNSNMIGPVHLSLSSSAQKWLVLGMIHSIIICCCDPPRAQLGKHNVTGVSAKYRLITKGCNNDYNHVHIRTSSWVLCIYKIIVLNFVVNTFTVHMQAL